MSVIRHPAACEVCSGKLNGSAEIALEREGDEYFLNVEQTAPLDWGICPRCKRIACFAACWDKARSYCRSCPSFDEAGDCPECGRILTGAIEVVEAETFGIPTILLKETSDRNWIQCDACSLVVCKKCCLDPKSGFCDSCLARRRGGAAKPNCPVITEFGRHRLGGAKPQPATATKTQNNRGGQIK